MPVSNRDVRAVQVAYPKIYFACHTRHVKRASTAVQLSATDSTLLAHLDEARPMRVTALARHLGVAPSTVSAAVNRLAGLGYVTQTRSSTDGRAIELTLSKKGASAMQASSVLDTALVRRALGRLSAPDREHALEGLTLLARAASGEAIR